MDVINDEICHSTIKFFQMMKKGMIYTMVALTTLLGSCVSTKKYNDLLNQQKECNSELEKYKASSIDFESKFKDCNTRLNLLKADAASLVSDTTIIGERYRDLQAQYGDLSRQIQDLETQLEITRKKGRTDTGNLQDALDAKSEELRRKQIQLQDLEKELQNKQALLAERENRVNDLEEIINRKDQAIAQIKQKIINALKPYEDKGLSIVEKDGKIYVRLEAKLLFNTGSTEVEKEGKQALIDLSKLLENEKDIEIIVEGHTDTDKLASPRHPRDNWELSVLRATSVVEIMLNNSKIDPKMLVASGRSEYYPVDPNDKSKNRRIEIIISPNLKALFDLISK